MKWSFKLVRVAGIDVYIHATLIILLIWLGLSYWAVEGTLGAALNGVSFILTLFTCVVLHEFGHALTAKRYGIRTQHITLFPIGGLAAMERMPDVPKHEIAVALAGPAVNLIIAILLWFWLTVTNTMISADELTLTGGPFAQRLMLFNIILVVFNLIPAFPMDGGRVLRAVLELRMNHNRATQLAAKVGQGFALWLGLMGLMFNPFLMFIALFVWIGAASEAAAEEMKSTLLGISAGQAMLTDFNVLSSHDRLDRAIQLTLAGSQKDFPVLDGEAIVGVLTQNDLLRGLHEHGAQASVGSWMQTGLQYADKDEPLDEVLERLQSDKCRLFAVIEAGHLAGIVNMDNVIELISIQKALH